MSWTRYPSKSQSPDSQGHVTSDVFVGSRGCICPAFGYWQLAAELSGQARGRLQSGVAKLYVVTPIVSTLTVYMHLDFEVTQPLPNVTFPLGRNWAGNIPVDRPGHPNDTLFFWAFEKEDGSLTADDSDEPWGIWLNGGYVGHSDRLYELLMVYSPGSSSLLGLFVEVSAKLAPAIDN